MRAQPFVLSNKQEGRLDRLFGLAVAKDGSEAVEKMELSAQTLIKLEELEIPNFLWMKQEGGLDCLSKRINRRASSTVYSDYQW